MRKKKSKIGACECDLNHDGSCDMLDWFLFGEDWGRTDCPIPYKKPLTLTIDGAIFAADFGRTDCPVCK